MKSKVIAKIIIFDIHGNILLLRRSSTAPRRALVWDLPGGRVEPSERPESSIMRETFEETRLTVDNITLVRNDSWRDKNTLQITKYLFCSNQFHGDIILSFEHDKYRWIATGDLSRINFPVTFRDGGLDRNDINNAKQRLE